MIFMYFLNIVTLYDVIYVQTSEILVTPWLFVLQFISNKSKIVHSVLDESDYYTSIYLINNQEKIEKYLTYNIFIHI